LADSLELFLEIPLSEFRCTVFIPLGSGMDGACGGEAYRAEAAARHQGILLRIEDNP